MVLRRLLKFLVVFFVLVLILGGILGGVGYFAVRNFDPNMFRAEFEKYLTQQTGFRVELGDIQLRWRPQPQLQVGGLKFYHPVNLEKILQGEQVQIDMDLTSLWQKRFNMSQAVIQSPEVFLKRDREGVWNWEFVKNSKPAVPASAPLLSQLSLIPTAEASEGADSLSLANLNSITQGWEFGVGKILVKNATVHFVDQTAEPAFIFDLERLDAEVFQRKSSAPFHFTAGGTVLGYAKRNLEAEGDLDLAAKALDFLLRYGPEKAELKGVCKWANELPSFEGALVIRDLDMDSVIPAVYKTGDYVAGRLSAKTNLSFSGANPVAIKRSLAGQGTLEIKEGALKNRNLIREVFDRLSSVIAITQGLGGELPPEMNAMMKGSDTPFDSLQVAYAAQSGILKVSELRLIHPNYQLAGQGSYGLLDQRVDSSMQLNLATSISAYLMKKIRELAYLADRTGQVMIPFRCSGVVPDVSVQPDLPFIASRLLQGGADQLLSRGLAKVLGTQKTGQSVPAGDPVSQGLGTVLGVPPTPSSEPVSESDQLIQQGLALFAKFQEGKKK